MIIETTPAGGGGLNPFYFRAGLLPSTGARNRKSACLNPFYFRAGLLPTHKTAAAAAAAVLIPFISGLDCYAADWERRDGTPS